MEYEKNQTNIKVNLKSKYNPDFQKNQWEPLHSLEEILSLLNTPPPVKIQQSKISI